MADLGQILTTASNVINQGAQDWLTISNTIARSGVAGQQVQFQNQLQQLQAEQQLQQAQTNQYIGLGLIALVGIVLVVAAVRRL